MKINRSSCLFSYSYVYSLLIYLLQKEPVQDERLKSLKN